MTSRVTVVILSHRPRYLAQAVASVLAQTVPVNLIVQHDRDGWPGKLNEAVAASRREFVLPLCDDDLLAPTYVARCLEVADDADVAFTDRKMWWAGRMDPRNWRSWVKRTPRFAHHHQMWGVKLVEHITTQGGRAARAKIRPEHFAFGAPYPMTCMIRRALWNDLGGYDDTIKHADTELWYRMVKAGARVFYIPEPLFLYRFHNDQLSAQQRSNGQAALDFHAKHFADFGFAFTDNPDDPTQADCTIIPPEERAEYVRRHGMKVA